jgi:hypothetical protein
MSTTVNHHHRQFMEHLSAERWVKATDLPESKRLIPKLLDNGWIEAKGDGIERSYRMTANGVAAKMAQVRV